MLARSTMLSLLPASGATGTLRRRQGGGSDRIARALDARRYTQDFQTMLALGETSADIWRELGDDLGLATSAHTRAWAHAGLGRITEADAQFHEALRYARAAGAQRWIAHIYNSLGNLRVELGEFSAARPFLMEALTSARTAGDRAEVAETLADLGWLCLELDEMAAAAVHFRDSLSLLAGSGRIYQTVVCPRRVAVLAARTGQRERSRAILAATHDDAPEDWRCRRTGPAAQYT